jgi:hypothetical protein
MVISSTMARASTPHPTTNPCVGVAQYRLCLRDAKAKSNAADFATLFAFDQGLCNEIKHVTPSHVSRVWQIIQALVEIGCKNLCVSNKSLREACKFEFNNDASAYKYKGFELNMSDASDHVCTVLYLLRAFYRENAINAEIITQRGRKYQKTNKFRSQCQGSDHTLLNLLSDMIELDIIWESNHNAYQLVPYPAIPFSFAHGRKPDPTTRSQPSIAAAQPPPAPVSDEQKAQPRQADKVQTPRKNSATDIFSNFFSSAAPIDADSTDYEAMYNIAKPSAFAKLPSMLKATPTPEIVEKQKYMQNIYMHTYIHVSLCIPATTYTPTLRHCAHRRRPVRFAPDVQI